MNPDPRTNPVTARVIFEGVMLMCINQHQQYEVGMIQCPLHHPKISIVESTVGFNPKERDIVWPEGHDLIFKVNNHENEGVTLFHNPGEATDFDKVIDLESPDFHAAGVTVETDLLQGRRLAITAGTVYSHKLTAVKFDLFTWDDENDIGTPVGTNLGKVADQIGIKIVCNDEPGSGIDIVDYTTGAVIESLSERDTTYVITVNNDCRRDNGPQGGPGLIAHRGNGPTRPEPTPPASEPTPPASETTASGSETTPPRGGTAPQNTNPIGTDFRFYYGLLKSRDGRKFDLSIRVDEDDERGPAPSPGACEATFLGETGTLGLHGQPT